VLSIVSTSSPAAPFRIAAEFSSNRSLRVAVLLCPHRKDFPATLPIVPCYSVASRVSFFTQFFFGCDFYSVDRDRINVRSLSSDSVLSFSSIIRRRQCRVRYFARASSGHVRSLQFQSRFVESFSTATRQRDTGWVVDASLPPAEAPTLQDRA